MAFVQGYMLCQCFLICGFVIGLSKGADFHTTELNATSTHHFLFPDWENIVKSDKIYVWIISAESEGARVKIGSWNFNFKEKGNNLTCSQYLQVNDGRSPTENILGRWCGIFGPAVTSSGPALTVVYMPDDSHGSFNLDYIELSDDLVPLSSQISLQADNQTRTISSPGYPLNYYNNMNYTWTIQAQPGGRVTSNIDSLDLGKQAIHLFDHIQFIDGNSTLDQLLGDIYSTDDGTQFISTGTYLTVWFRSYTAYVGTGFQIQYREVAMPSGCSPGILNAKSGVTSYIQSPGYPMYSQSIQTCTWTITTASYFKYVKVEGLWLELEVSSGCEKDHLAFYDDTLCEEIGRVCGNKASTGFTYQSDSQQMIIKFRSYGRVPSLFWLKYTALSKREVNLNDDKAHILTSPNYPQLYPENTDEWWRIHSPIGIVKMASLTFSLEYNAMCRADYLEVYDGYDESSPLINRWCGIDSITASSTGIFMYVKFHSNGVIQGTGFQLSFTASEETSTPARENYGIIASAVVMSIIGLIVVISIVACFVASRRKRSTPSTRTTAHTSPPREVTVVYDNRESMTPPGYSEVVKDRPPTYFEATSGGNDNLVTRDSELIGVETSHSRL